MFCCTENEPYEGLTIKVCEDGWFSQYSL